MSEQHAIAVRRESNTRRSFLRTSLFTTAALSLANWPRAELLLSRAEAAPLDLVRDTLNGFLALIVPGPDAYSQSQGVTTPEPGGVDANVLNALIATLDLSIPFLPPFSAVVAGTLNQLAQVMNPTATGPFSSSFSNLRYAEKVSVLQIMDSTDQLKSLGGVLPALVAYLVYSDAGTFDSKTRTITGRPVGWQISNYTGVADAQLISRLLRESPQCGLQCVSKELLMRDVIVVGAGGGGAVVAKELAGRGLDVLLLEAGARFADLEQDWTHLESDGITLTWDISVSDRRIGPSLSGSAKLIPACSSFNWQAVGGSTNHYQGNSPPAMPGAFIGRVSDVGPVGPHRTLVVDP